MEKNNRQEDSTQNKHLSATGLTTESSTTSRGLKNRHIQLIAIAGAIGTGLFMGASHSIALTGPSIIFVYLVIGFFMFILLRAIGEMLYTDTEQHSFLNFVTRYLGSKIGYFSQWSYWLVVIFTAMAELTAIGSYLQLWLPNVPTWLTETIILILLFGLNTLSAKFFGETEFWFGTIKIIAIVGLIVTAIFLVFFHFNYNTNIVIDNAKIHAQGSASLINIVKDFQFFPNGVTNFFASFQMVMFAFVAMEFIGMTAAETENPRPTLKKAINQIPVRIIIFYVGALLAIMSIIQWKNLEKVDTHSPFVFVFLLIGVKWAAAIINFVVLTSAASSLNSCLFSTTRNLYSLSKLHKDKALRPFTKLSKSGIPLNALIFTSFLVFLTPFVSMLPGVSNAFVFITSVATDLFLIVYILTLFTFLKFRKSADFLEDGFKVPAAKILVPLTIVGFAFIFISLFFFKDTLIPALGTVAWTIVFGAISFVRKDKRALS